MAYADDQQRILAALLAKRAAAAGPKSKTKGDPSAIQGAMQGAQQGFAQPGLQNAVVGANTKFNARGRWTPAYAKFYDAHGGDLGFQQRQTKRLVRRPKTGF